MNLFNNFKTHKSKKILKKYLLKSKFFFNYFIKSSNIVSYILICCTILSIILNNTFLSKYYNNIFHYKISNYSIEFIINDGLMSIFFLLVGLELKKELVIGSLSNLKNALLPIAGAIGGMLIPAFIYLIFNINTNTQIGWGIPMATDIAFAITILNFMGNKIHKNLKTFLIALAIVDDLGAIVTIALFYSKNISIYFIIISLILIIILFILNYINCKSLIIYLFIGIILWYCLLQSGIHSTISGVILAFLIPINNGEKNNISFKLEHYLQKPVNFIILPFFALANTNIKIDNNSINNLLSNYSLGIILGLLIGKPLGICLFSLFAIKFNIASLPKNTYWLQFISLNILGGIGFTMSIFITNLAFDNQQIINDSKLAITISSLIAIILGYTFLKIFNKPKYLLNNQ